MKQDALVQELLARHGAAHKDRIERGLSQISALWRESDGDMREFALTHFLADEDALAKSFARLEGVLEQLDGHFNEISRELRWATDTETGPLLNLDLILSSLDVSSHLSEDLFTSKVAFVALLNWPLVPLQQRIAEGHRYHRKDWAERRLTSRFSKRIPSEAQQAVAAAGAAADIYVSQYNLWLHHALDESGARLFPKGARHISHWGLRDELKAAYAEGTQGLPKQRLIAQVMARVIDQSIPQAVIDNPTVDWNPWTNALSPSPKEACEGPSPGQRPGGREPDTRYRHLLAQFHAQRMADPHAPVAPTALARSFEGREMPEERVRELLVSVLSSEAVPKVAAAIARRLGRPLEPHDLWYSGFQAKAAIPEDELSGIVSKRYPTADAFAADMPRLLVKLGFSTGKAKFLAERIRVDPGRGAGHAMPALRRGDFPRLRTRIESGGMNYKGFNVAIHEMGHNVEQVFSLYGIDHTLLQGVPNNAFTEAFAFVFQSRDLELLDLGAPAAGTEEIQALADFWQTFEIAGVSLVDIETWKFMYQNPNADPAALKEAVMGIARDIWNRYYAEILGGKDSTLLAIYSHMIAYPLYLCDYPLGHLIAFQIKKHLAKSGDFGSELERMATLGAIAPDAWMQRATGSEISARPLVQAASSATGEAA